MQKLIFLLISRCFLQSQAHILPAYRTTYKNLRLADEDMEKLSTSSDNFDVNFLSDHSNSGGGSSPNHSDSDATSNDAVSSDDIPSSSGPNSCQSFSSEMEHSPPVRCYDTSDDAQESYVVTDTD